MIEILTVVALLFLFRFLLRSSNKEKVSFADENENNSRKHYPISIVGESRFVLSSEKKKYAEIKEPGSNSSGKMDIEVSLDYVAEDIDLLEEQEELERLGLQNDYSLNITFDEMMTVVDEVGNNQAETNPQTGKLLYENENTDWVEQLATFSENSTMRIAALIDLHLGRLDQANSNVKPDDAVRDFDIGEYVE